MSTIAIQFATCMFGAISDESKKLILKYLEKPTQARWDKIYSLIIDGRGKMRTVWQAVVEIDPSFPQRIPADGRNRWPEIPSRETLIKALNSTVFKLNEN